MQPIQHAVKRDVPVSRATHKARGSLCLRLARPALDRDSVFTEKLVKNETNEWRKKSEEKKNRMSEKVLKQLKKKDFL